MNLVNSKQRNIVRVMNRTYPKSSRELSIYLFSRNIFLRSSRAFRNIFTISRYIMERFCNVFVACVR